MATSMPGTMCESAGIGKAVDSCAYQVGPTLTELIKKPSIRMINVKVRNITALCNCCTLRCCYSFSMSLKVRTVMSSDAGKSSSSYRVQFAQHQPNVASTRVCQPATHGHMVTWSHVMSTYDRQSTF